MRTEHDRSFFRVVHGLFSAWMIWPTKALKSIESTFPYKSLSFVGDNAMYLDICEIFDFGKNFFWIFWDTNQGMTLGKNGYAR